MARILIGNIKGPKGDTGAKGATGPQGPAGPQGPLPSLTNNALATTPGVSALDAVMGKTLNEKIGGVISDLGALTGEASYTICDVQNYTTPSGQALQYSKVARIVELTGRIVSTAASAGASDSGLVTTLPVGYRPSKAITVPIMVTSYSEQCRCIINTDGTVLVQRANGQLIPTGYTISIHCLFRQRN